MVKLASTWQADGLYELLKTSSFENATKHWQAKALACFIEEGFPSRRVEAWRYVDLDNVLAQPFSINEIKSSVTVMPDTIADSYRLVFVNGVLDLEQSTLNDTVLILPLEELLKTADETLLRELRVELDTPYFAGLNSAFMRQGCYIKLKPNTTLDKPLHILHITTAVADVAAMQTLRFFIDADKNSEAVILEEHVGLGEGVYFNNIVTQINLNFDSRLTYYKFQRDSKQAYHMATTIASLSAHSMFRYNMIANGAQLNREECYVRHYERHSEAHLLGFYHAQQQGKTFQHTRVDHFKGQCTTRQEYKGMAREQGQAVFDGKMVVRPGAHQSAVHQLCHNLLLSDHAEIDVKPNLEIYTDDVVASHGATVGQLDDEALFYMQSRGIAESVARDLLVTSFIESLFEKMPQNTVTAYVREQFLGSVQHV